jgi:hypothetical protein
MLCFDRFALHRTPTLCPVDLSESGVQPVRLAFTVTRRIRPVGCAGEREQPRTPIRPALSCRNGHRGIEHAPGSLAMSNAWRCP